MPVAPPPNRPTAPGRPQLQAPAAVVPQAPQTPAAPVAQVTPPVAPVAPVETPAAPVAPVAAVPATPVAPEVPQGVAPVAAAPEATSTSGEKKKRGRAPKNLEKFWAILAVDANGQQIVNSADGKPVTVQLEAPPALYTGTQKQAEAGEVLQITAADGTVSQDYGFNQEKHEALTKDDFKKKSDYFRHRANLMTQQAAWLNAHAADIDAGKATASRSGGKQVSEMRNAMAELFATLEAQGLSKELLLSKMSAGAIAAMTGAK